MKITCIFCISVLCVLVLKIVRDNPEVRFAARFKLLNFGSFYVLSHKLREREEYTVGAGLAAQPNTTRQRTTLIF